MLQLLRDFYNYADHVKELSGLDVLMDTMAQLTAKMGSLDTLCRTKYMSTDAGRTSGSECTADSQGREDGQEQGDSKKMRQSAVLALQKAGYVVQEPFEINEPGFSPMFKVCAS